MDISEGFEVTYRQASEVTEEYAKVYVITREGVESLRKRLLDPSQAGECRAELQKLLEIKEVLSWRAEVALCCAAQVMSPGLYGEAQTLRAALDAFDKGSYEEAASLVSDFSQEAERNGSYRIW